MSPFFSIVIPTYNQCELLKKAIYSVEMQTFKDNEIIVIDNSTNDDTYNFLKTKKKIIYKKIKNDGIIAKSRNLGIENSKGQWVCFLDTDDAWFKKKLEKTFNEINKKNFDVICNDEWIVDNLNNTKKIWSYGPYEKNFYKKLLLFGNRNSTSATTVRKKFLLNNNIKFNERSDFVTAEDYEFFLNIALNKGVFHYLHLPLGVHLFHEKSESAIPKRLHQAQFQVLRYHIFNNKNSNNKDFLWKKVKKISEVKLSILFFKKNPSFLQIINILYKIFYVPIYSVTLFKYLVKKKILQNSLMRIHKSDETSCKGM